MQLHKHDLALPAPAFIAVLKRLFQLLRKYLSDEVDERKRCPVAVVRLLLANYRIGITVRYTWGVYRVSVKTHTLPPTNKFWNNTQLSQLASGHIFTWPMEVIFVFIRKVENWCLSVGGGEGGGEGAQNRLSLVSNYHLGIAVIYTWGVYRVSFGPKPLRLSILNKHV